MSFKIWLVFLILLLTGTVTYSDTVCPVGQRSSMGDYNRIASEKKCWSGWTGVKNTSECSDEFLCCRLTYYDEYTIDLGVYYFSWRSVVPKSNNEKFQTEAKKRKLTCGVVPTYERGLSGKFKKFSSKQRKIIQTNLKDLGLYKSSIDGLYGKGTLEGLKKYNKYHLGETDLNDWMNNNIDKLYDALLTIVPKTVPKTNVPVTKTEKENIERLIEIQKEFGLSFYGGFFHSVQMPNSLFFFDDIRPRDSFEFHKALRNHDITLVVLSSRGGDVDEGLLMAGKIKDRELNTYVANNSLGGRGNCASACSYMFFAGKSRIAEGDLGVHQFYSSQASNEDKIGATQKRAQKTVSEIIGFLNEFKTPPWVFERMFQQKDMYYFKESELLQIETEVSDETKVQHENAEKFISDLITAFNK